MKSACSIITSACSERILPLEFWAHAGAASGSNSLAFAEEMKNKNFAVSSLPQIVYIPSRWESHVVLKRLQELNFPPKVADRKPLWQDALAREMRQCHADLPANEHVHHTWWIKFAESLHHIAEPSTSWHKALCPPRSLDAETQVPAAASLEDEEACAPYAPVMRSGTSMDAPTTRSAEFAGLSELAASA